METRPSWETLTVRAGERVLAGDDWVVALFHWLRRGTLQQGTTFTDAAGEPTTT